MSLNIHEIPEMNEGSAVQVPESCRTHWGHLVLINHGFSVRLVSDFSKFYNVMSMALANLGRIDSTGAILDVEKGNLGINRVSITIPCSNLAGENTLKWGDPIQRWGEYKARSFELRKASGWEISKTADHEVGGINIEFKLKDGEPLDFVGRQWEPGHKLILANFSPNTTEYVFNRVASQHRLPLDLPEPQLLQAMNSISTRVMSKVTSKLKA